jgi:hypothetical protein
VITSFWRTVPRKIAALLSGRCAGLDAKRRSAMSFGLPYGHCSQSSPIFENLKAVDIASIDAHADRCERHRWRRVSGGGKATRLLTDARQSLAKAAFPAAGRQDDNSGKAQRTLQPIHSGAKYEDHNTRRSGPPFQPSRCKSDACRGSCERQRVTMRLNKNTVRSGEYLVSPLVKPWRHQQIQSAQAMRLRDTKGQA